MLLIGSGDHRATVDVGMVLCKPLQIGRVEMAVDRDMIVLGQGVHMEEGLIDRRRGRRQRSGSWRRGETQEGG